MLLPKGIHVKVLNQIVWELRDRGLWVERHSYSFRVFRNERIVGSFHIYPGYNEVILRIIDKQAGEEVITIIVDVLKKHLPEYKVVIE